MNKISTTSNVLRSAVVVLIAGSAFAMAHADAATFRANYFSATAVCAGPIPSSDGALRRSPLGIRNQGDINVFISCSVPGDFVGDQATGTLEPFFHSFGTGSATINCTLTAGNRLNGFGSVAGSTNITAGGDAGLTWSNADKVSAFGSYNFSCILPPDVELGLIYVQQVDTGNEF